MDVRQLVDQFAREHQVTQFALNEHGCAALEVKQGYVLNFEWDESRQLLHLFATLAPLPAQGLEQLYAELLDANLFGAGTAGAVLARDGLDHSVMLCQCLDPAQISAPAFSALVSNFLDTADHWRERIASFRPQQSSADAAPMHKPAQTPSQTFSASDMLMNNMLRA